MSANLHTHLARLCYDTTPSYTTTYHFPLEQTHTVLCFNPPPSPSSSTSSPAHRCSISILFHPLSFLLLSPASAAQQRPSCHSVSRKNTCRKALLCFMLSVHNTASICPVRRMPGMSTASRDHLSSVQLLTSLKSLQSAHLWKGTFPT